MHRLLGLVEEAWAMPVTDVLRPAEMSHRLEIIPTGKQMVLAPASALKIVFLPGTRVATISNSSISHRMKG